MAKQKCMDAQWLYPFSFMVYRNHGEVHTYGPHLAVASFCPIKGLFGHAASQFVSTQARKLADVVARQQD